MTRRRNRKPGGNSPEALAARLPDELKTFKSYADSGDLQSHWTAVADWLNTQAPGRGEELSMANWPTHARKRAHKRPNRHRIIADLAKEQLEREKTSGVRV